MHDHLASQGLFSDSIIEKYSSNVIQRGLVLANKINKNHSQNIEIIDLSGQEIAQNCLQNGKFYYNLESYQEAVDNFSLALNITPDLIEACFFRCLSYVCLMKFSLALEDYQKSYQINSQIAEQCFREINSVKRNLNEEGTKNILQIILSIGNHYYEINNYEKAVEVYTNILWFNSNDFNAYNRRSSAYSALKYYKEATDDLQRANNSITNEEKYLDFKEYLQLLDVLFSTIDEVSDILPEFVEDFYESFQNGFGKSFQSK